MQEDWYDRLRAAIQKELDRGRSMADISAAAGLSENYVGQLMRRRKNAGSDSVGRLCQALGVSKTYIFDGFELGSLEEEAASLLAGLPDEEKEVWVQHLRVRRAQRPNA